MTIKTSLKGVTIESRRKQETFFSLFLFLSLLRMRASSEVFASCNMRESPREETGMFYFHACITGFACHFLTLWEERDFCARERHDFSFSTSTVKLTSKSLRCERSIIFYPSRKPGRQCTRIYKVSQTLRVIPRLIRCFGESDIDISSIELNMIYFCISVIWKSILKIQQMTADGDKFNNRAFANLKDPKGLFRCSIENQKSLKKEGTAIDLASKNCFKKEKTIDTDIRNHRNSAGNMCKPR